MTDYYAVLGVTEIADEDVIAAAYRALAKKYHPDTGSHRGTASAEKFQEIQEAFEVLGNQSSRTEYDEQRKTADQDPSTSEHISEPKGGSADHHPEKSAPDMAPNRVSARKALPTSIAALLVATVALAISAYSLFPSGQMSTAQLPSEETAPAPTITNEYEQEVGDTVTNASNSSTFQKDEKQIDSPMVGEQSVANEINDKVEQGRSLPPKDYSSFQKGKKQVYARIVGEQEIDSEYDLSPITLPQMLQEQGKGTMPTAAQPALQVDPSQ